jgi:hypothetical protein
VSDLVGEALRRTLPDHLGRIAKLLEDSGIPLEEIAKIDRVRVGTYQTAVKVRDEHGVERIEQVVNAADSVTLTPRAVWETGPAWPVVQPASPVKIPASRAKPVETDTLTTVVVPDPQIGWWLVDGEWIPMHDPAAMSLAVTIVAKAKPSSVIVLGDVLDLADWSTKFSRTPTAAGMTQATLDTAHEWLAQLVAAANGAPVSMIAGNHDARLNRYIVDNAAAAFGLKRANTPESWPVMSVPYLLRFGTDTNAGEIPVDYRPGYPAAQVWLRDDIVAHHGKHTSAHRAARDPVAVSTIQGHTHRLSVETKTLLGLGGAPMHTVHVAAGCLCRIDGAVPSYHSATDDTGRPIPTVENWQQGVVVLTFTPEPGPIPTVELVPIHNGRTVWRGRTYDA